MPTPGFRAGAPGEFSNFPQIAGFYSQLAGVLAGFAFAALITLIASQLVAASSLDMTLRSYRPLISAFLGLVATSLNYAIIAGEERDTARLAELEITAGAGFCVAALMVLYAILVLLRGVEKDLAAAGTMSGRTADLLRNTLVFGVCPLLTVMMYGTLRDHNLVKYGDSQFRGLDLAALIILALTIALWPFMIAFFKLPSGGSAMIENISRGGVAIAVLSLLASTLTISFSSSGSSRSDCFPLVCLLVLTLHNWSVMYSAARYKL